MQERITRYEVWLDEDGPMLSAAEKFEQQCRDKTLPPKSRRIHVIHAATWEEAKAIFGLRMGFGPNTPNGDPQLCPQGCGSYFYPEGSGQCPYCGQVM